MELKYLKDLWNDADTVGMDEPELLRYRSNLLGSDKRLTNFGGGNTSAKIPMQDPVTGETVEVLWVKGSGGDLGTIKRDGFATLYMDRLNALKKQYKGLAYEDEMPDMYPLCTFGINPRAASIDTPLHGFLPFKHVDHLHPDWAIALAACCQRPGNWKTLEAGDRPETGLAALEAPRLRTRPLAGKGRTRRTRTADGILLGSHGLFTWGDTGRESYLNTLRVIDGIGQFVLKRVEAEGDNTLRRAARADAPGRGANSPPASCPSCAARSARTSGISTTARTCCTSSTATGARRWPIREPAARITSYAPKSARCIVDWDVASGRCGEPDSAAPQRPGRLPRRLRRLLRGEQAAQFARHALRQPDRRAGSRRRPVQFRAQQGRGAHHRRVLRQRHSRHGGRDGPDGQADSCP